MHQLLFLVNYFWTAENTNFGPDIKQRQYKFKFLKQLIENTSGDIIT